MFNWSETLVSETHMLWIATEPRKGIKGDRLIEKEAEDSVPSKALGWYQLLIVSQLSIFKLNIHSLTVFRNDGQIVSNKNQKAIQFYHQATTRVGIWFVLLLQLVFIPFSLNNSVDLASYQQSLKTF